MQKITKVSSVLNADCPNPNYGIVLTAEQKATKANSVLNAERQKKQQKHGTVNAATKASQENSAQNAEKERVKTDVRQS